MAFGNDLTDSDKNILETVASGLGAVDVEANGSVVLLLGTVVWAVNVEATGSLGLLFTTDQLLDSVT